MEQVNYSTFMQQPRQSRSANAALPARAAERPAEKPVDFILNLPGAKSASVAGSFNDWDINRTPLRKDPNGGWKTTVWLQPGRYEYRFVIDGAQWFSDPGAKESVPNKFGSTNSVVTV
jgi:1,4-alpha-glucan branching enzyme